MDGSAYGVMRHETYSEPRPITWIGCHAIESGHFQSQFSALASDDMGGNPMRNLTKLLHSVMRDEQGGEVLEYALIAGLIVVAAIAMIGRVGSRVMARWASLNSSM